MCTLFYTVCVVILFVCIIIHSVNAFLFHTHRKGGEVKNEIITPDMLNCDQYRTFWVSWADGLISLSRGSPQDVWVSWQDPEPSPVYAVSLDTADSVAGDWEIVKFTGTLKTT